MSSSDITAILIKKKIESLCEWEERKVPDTQCLRGTEHAVDTVHRAGKSLS